MIIVGANGFAKELLEIFHLKNELNNIVFYDDVSQSGSNLLFGKFPLLKNEEEVLLYFKNDNPKEFTLGIGEPSLRYKLYEKFKKLGGHFTSVISLYARIGHYEVNIGLGSNILSNATVSNCTSTGKGCLIYYNVIITHDCNIGDFVELSPGATILGRCTIGAFSKIGANATILPDIKIGRNVTIGAGAVVTKDVPDYSVAVGVPAKVIKVNTPSNINY